jgi:hypothetical protein
VRGDAGRAVEACPVQNRIQRLELEPEQADTGRCHKEETAMHRFVLIIAGLGLAASTCCAQKPGKVLFKHDKDGHYVELREGEPGYVRSGPAVVKGRPELKDLREVHGDLSDVCRDMHGLENPRLVIESKNKRDYQVVYNKGPESLKLVAKHLGLVVVQEDRKIDAIVLRVAKGGHRLKATPKDKPSGDRADDKGLWHVEGMTTDELAEHLETGFSRPVVDLTSLRGRWSFSLPVKATRTPPDEDETLKLGDLGLEVRREKVKLRVTVVKDKPK